jgi:hypothetical protein
MWSAAESIPNAQRLFASWKWIVKARDLRLIPMQMQVHRFVDEWMDGWMDVRRTSDIGH